MLDVASRHVKQWSQVTSVYTAHTFRACRPASAENMHKHRFGLVGHLMGEAHKIRIGVIIFQRWIRRRIPL